MFDASAPPERIVCTPAARLNAPVIWNIQVSVEPPDIVKEVAAVTALVHRYSPGNKTSPPMMPLSRFKKLGFVLPIALV